MQHLASRNLQKLCTICMLIVGAAPADAVDRTIRVTILQVDALDCVDEATMPWGEICRSDADFYPTITIADETFNLQSRAILNDDHITPGTGDGWEFSKDFSPAQGTNFQVTIRLDDLDNAFPDPPPDDAVDLDSDANSRALDLNVAITPPGAAGAFDLCDITGDVTGDCGATLTSQGASGDSASIGFRIDVVEAPFDAGLNVRCLHAPVWPQPGEAVTVNAAALDANLAAVAATTIEIWVDTQVAPALSCAGVATCSFTAPAPAGPSLTYGCRVLNGGQVAWTGWRVVTVGPAANSTAVPIVFNGPRGSRIDVVFIPNKNDYSGATDPNFLTDVAKTLNQSYYNDAFFLANQQRFNFWIAPDMGESFGMDANAVPPGRCDNAAPSNWDSDYTFADAGALLHRACFRDCASGETGDFAGLSLPNERLFSIQMSQPDVDLNGNGNLSESEIDNDGDGNCNGPADTNMDGDAQCEADADWNGNGAFDTCDPQFPGPLGVVLHETGHMPFGLADEYCCDGGYFQTDAVPNLYEEKSTGWERPFQPGCTDDAPNLGRTAAACRGFNSQRFPQNGFDWFLSEPASNDLMNDNSQPQAADTRRINWVFGQCRGARC